MASTENARRFSEHLPYKRRESPEKRIARLKYWGWQCFTKPIMGLIYLAVISEGLRLLVPVLGQRLYKLPGLGFLEEYESTYKLDLAPLFVVFLLIAVWHLWAKVIELWIARDDDAWWNTESHKVLVRMLAVTILGADGFLFYASVSQMGWSATLSVSAFVATAAYVGVTIFVSYISVCLRKDMERWE